SAISCDACLTLAALAAGCGPSGSGMVANAVPLHTSPLKSVMFVYNGMLQRISVRGNGSTSLPSATNGAQRGVTIAFHNTGNALRETLLVAIHSPDPAY